MVIWRSASVRLRSPGLASRVRAGASAEERSLAESTRPDTIRNNRVILDVAAVPAGKGYGGEARVATDMIDRVVADAEIRCDGVCYDGAFNVYDRCYGWREDAESLNNTLDRTRYGGRMIAYTAVRQLTVMLNPHWSANAMAAYLHRRRHHDERAA